MKLFQKKIAVIYLLREKVKFGVVVLQKNPKIEDEKEYVWTQDKLPEILTKIGTKIGKNVRIVVATDLSYTLSLSAPKDLGDIRNFISQKISEEIPEMLSDSDWDFKKISESLTEKQLIVFSPVKSIFNLFLDEALKSGFKVVSVEPAEIAIKRNINPLIGTALKKDIFGKDEDVLNLEKNNTKGNFLKISTIFTFFLVGLVLIIFLVFSAGKINFAKFNKTTPVPTPSLSRRDLKLEVLNGSGDNTESSEVQSILESQGYQGVVVRDVNSYEFKGLEIEIKSDKKNYISLISTDLSKNFSINSVSESLDKESKFDVIIMMGKI